MSVSIHLTNEQKAVVEALGSYDMVKVNAFAGTGKTTTLLEMIRAYPEKRFLYLVFNRRNREEAKEKLERAGIRNAEVYTVHGYAHRKTRKFHGGQVKPNRPNTALIKEITKAKDIVVASMVWEVFNAWLASDYETFSADVIDEIAAEKEINAHLYLQVKALKEYMEKEHHITHDFYLKHFQQNFWQLETGRYDVVLLDEAQDSNPITLWLFERIPAKQRVLVGDVHQQIYTFRGSVNAMQQVPADITLPLTGSFRFGPEIAEIANDILAIFKAEDNKLRGLKQEKTSATKAYLSRSNARLIQVMDSLGDTRWRTIRQSEEIFAAPLTILSIVRSNTENEVQRVLGDRMAAYLYLKNNLHLNSLAGILEYAELVKDHEIYMAAKIVERYTEQLLPLFHMAKRKEYDKEAPIQLSTAHTAKGLEWDEVYVEDDFPNVASLMGDCDGIDSLDIWQERIADGDTDPSSLGRDMLAAIQEINLLYVAATRATSTLSWPYKFDADQVDRIIQLSASLRQEKQPVLQSKSLEGNS